MGKILVFIYDNMADFEMTFATYILGTDEKIEIIPISIEDKTVRSLAGLEYKPKKLVKDMLGEEVEGIIFPGGWYQEVEEELIKLVKDLYNQNKLVAAICAAPRFLAKAGILNEVKYTTSIKEWTDAHRERFKDESDPYPRENFIQSRVVKDRNVITADGIAFIDFGIEIADYFNIFTNEEEKLEFIKSVKGI